MALGTFVELNTSAVTISAADIANIGPWSTVIDAGGPAVVDLATVVNPTTQVTASTTHPFRRASSMGRYVQARLAYDDGISGTVTSPTIKCFGRSSVGEAWTLLRNRAGNLNGELTIDQTNDVQDGTYGYTTPHSANTTWETAGCDEFVFAIETKFNATGVLTNSFIQARVF